MNWRCAVCSNENIEGADTCGRCAYIKGATKESASIGGNGETDRPNGCAAAAASLFLFGFIVIALLAYIVSTSISFSK